MKHQEYQMIFNMFWGIAECSGWYFVWQDPTRQTTIEIGNYQYLLTKILNQSLDRPGKQVVKKLLCTRNWGYFLPTRFFVPPSWQPIWTTETPKTSSPWTKLQTKGNFNLSTLPHPQDQAFFALQASCPTCINLHKLSQLLQTQPTSVT